MVIILSIFCSDAELVVDLSQTGGCDPTCTVDFFVENMGRVNYGTNSYYIFMMHSLLDQMFLLTSCR